MKKTLKIWLLIAAALTIIGAVIFTCALSLTDFDFTKLSTQKFETNTYEFDVELEKISINTNTASVTFIPTDEDICKVVCFEYTNQKHTVTAEDGTLKINMTDSRKWYAHIGIFFDSPEITVYLPKDAYSSLSVRTETGNVEIPDSLGFDLIDITGETSNICCHTKASKSITVSTTTGNISLSSAEAETVKLSATTGDISISSTGSETVTLSATTGDITVKDTECGILTTENRTGKTHLKNVTAKEKLDAKSNTGNILLDRCDAPDITAEASTGNVTGTLLSDKIFITETSTGNVKVPISAGEEKCRITTSTGNIRIEIE